jgi:gas vesicle protein
MEKGTLIEGIAIGVVAGVIATLLLAPKSGKATREEIKAHLEEIKEALIKRLQAAGEFTQAKYDEIVKAIVGEYETAKKITAEEAREIESRLVEGYEAIREAACAHLCAAEKAPALEAPKAPKAHKAAVK